jgi:hypothetical protein
LRFTSIASINAAIVSSKKVVAPTAGDRGRAVGTGGEPA